MCIRYDQANPSGVYSPNDQIFKGHYVELLTFCDTYQFYPKIREHIAKRLNEKKIKRTALFDGIEMPDSMRALALS